MSAETITTILDCAEGYAALIRGRDKHSGACYGLALANLFLENSTRTRVSFELAGKRLGMDIVNLMAEGSSIRKGESGLDTALTLNAMQPDVMVIRHFEAGAVAAIAEHLDCVVINAGDGAGEHPTQALADALTMRRRKGRIEGLKVAICGDIAHSRVARSNAYLLGTLGAEVRLVAPPALAPENAGDTGATIYSDMAEGLAGVDVAMMLRIQRERLEVGEEPTPEAYFAGYGLSRERLALAAPDAIVMHPGPMNRGVEIAADVADDPERSAILEQVEMGVAVRMACLDLLTRDKRGA